MNSDPIYKIHQTFNKYGYISELEALDETQNIYGYARQSLQIIMGRHIKMTASFFGERSLEQFADDLTRVAELDYEAHLRSRNPALQNAYEEYQILLKLMK